MLSPFVSCTPNAINKIPTADKPLNIHIQTYISNITDNIGYSLANRNVNALIIIEQNTKHIVRILKQ